MEIHNLNQTLTPSSKMRIFLLLPLLLLLSSVVLSSISYSETKVRLTEDLNEAMIRMASSKSHLLASPDTIRALRHMKETVNEPIIYKASGLVTSNEVLQECTFFQIALLDESDNKDRDSKNEGVWRYSSRKVLTDKGIVSDSIVILPQGDMGGAAIELTGYAQCNIASVFFASDQRLSLILFILSLITFSLMLFKNPRQSKEVEQYESFPHIEAPLSNTQDVKDELLSPLCVNTKTESTLDALDWRQFKLTPMQRRFMEMLLKAPEYRVGKYDICEALWDGKDNAEESLYTLVRRTKQALKGSPIEIVCNRGESYELRITH